MPDDTSPAPLLIPVDGDLVLLEVPRDSRVLVAQSVLLSSALHRRTGRLIRKPSRFAEAVARNVVARREEWPQLRREIRAWVQMARRSEATQPASLPQLLDRVFIGRLQDGREIDYKPEEARLANLPWLLIDHAERGAGHCHACDHFRAADIDSFAALLGFEPVLLRILDDEFVLAGVLPPQTAIPDPAEF